jgi:Holliday junction resolvasome RuvABC endonuclease subunit
MIYSLYKFFGIILKLIKLYQLQEIVLEQIFINYNANYELKLWQAQRIEIFKAL